MSHPQAARVAALLIGMRVATGCVQSPPAGINVIAPLDAQSPVQGDAQTDVQGPGPVSDAFMAEDAVQSGNDAGGAAATDLGVSAAPDAAMRWPVAGCADLEPSNRQAGSRFGSRARTSADSILVVADGSQRPDVELRVAGAHHLFERTPAGFVEDLRIDSLAEARYSLSGSFFVQGDPAEHGGMGRVVIHHRSGGHWSPAPSVQPPDAKSTFGADVAQTDDRVLVAEHPEWDSPGQEVPIGFQGRIRAFRWDGASFQAAGSIDVSDFVPGVLGFALEPFRMVAAGGEIVIVRYHTREPSLYGFAALRVVGNRFTQVPILAPALAPRELLSNHGISIAGDRIVVSRREQGSETLSFLRDTGAAIVGVEPLELSGLDVRGVDVAGQRLALVDDAGRLVVRTWDAGGLGPSVPVALPPDAPLRWNHVGAFAATFIPGSDELVVTRPEALPDGESSGAVSVIGGDCFGQEVSSPECHCLPPPLPTCETPRRAENDRDRSCPRGFWAEHDTIGNGDGQPNLSIGSGECHRECTRNVDCTDPCLPLCMGVYLFEGGDVEASAPSFFVCTNGQPVVPAW